MKLRTIDITFRKRNTYKRPILDVTFKYVKRERMKVEYTFVGDRPCAFNTSIT